jgi:PAS domain S-box-containing protein
VALDITELEEKDKALRLSLDAARAGTWTWDVKTDEVVWDEQMQKIFGLESDTFAGTFEDWKKRVHPEDAKLAEQKTLIALNSGTSYEHEYRVKGLFGDWRWVNAQASTLLDENSTPIRMSGFAIDITDRKKAEEKLLKSEEKFRHLFDNSPIGKTITYVSGELQSNAALAEMLGYSQDEFRNFKWQDITHPDDMALSQNIIESDIIRQKGI